MGKKARSWQRSITGRGPRAPLQVQHPLPDLSRQFGSAGISAAGGEFATYSYSLLWEWASEKGDAAPFNLQGAFSCPDLISSPLHCTVAKQQRDVSGRQQARKQCRLSGSDGSGRLKSFWFDFDWVLCWWDTTMPRVRSIFQSFWGVHALRSHCVL